MQVRQRGSQAEVQAGDLHCIERILGTKRVGSCTLVGEVDGSNGFLDVGLQLVSTSSKGTVRITIVGTVKSSAVCKCRVNRRSD